MTVTKKAKNLGLWPLWDFFYTL